MLDGGQHSLLHANTLQLKEATLTCVLQKPPAWTLRKDVCAVINQDDMLQAARQLDDTLVLVLAEDASTTSCYSWKGFEPL